MRSFLGVLAGILALSSCATKTPAPVHTTYLIGRFSCPFTRPAVTARLVSQGWQVVPKLGAGVDLVVLGDEPVAESGDHFVPLPELD